MVKYTVRLPTGNEYGPADLATLRTWKEEGRIGADSWVWTEGAPEWLPLETVLAAGTDAPIPAASPAAASSAATPSTARPAAPTAKKAADRPAAPTAARAKAPAPTPSPAKKAEARPASRPAPGGAAKGAPAAGTPAGGASAPGDAAKPGGPGARRPRPTAGRSARPARASEGGQRWMLIAGGGVVALLALAWVGRAVLLPALGSWRAASRLAGDAAAERRFADAEAGLVLAPSGGWVLLKPESSLLVAPLATARLAHGTLGARATLTVRRQPPGLAPLDPFLDEVVGERRPLVEGYAEVGRTDAVLDGRPARRLSATWSEGGAPQKAMAVATRDAWVYVALLAWGPASAGDELDQAFESLVSALDVAGALEQRMADQATALLRGFPELSRPSVELLLRVRGEGSTDVAGLAVAMAATVGQGLSALDAAETRELQEIYGRVFEPMTDADRERLAAWQQAVRGGADPDPAQTRAVRESLRASLGRLPGETLVALQALNEKAVFAGARRP